MFICAAVLTHAGSEEHSDPLRFLYDRAIEAVPDVSLDVPTGQIVALLGSNGAGKSTILKAISGVLYQEDGEIMSGSIQLEGEQVSGRTPRDIVEKGVLQGPEGRALFATLTDMPPSVNLAAPAGCDYLVADYGALSGAGGRRLHEKAKKYVTPEEIEAINRYTFVTYVGLMAMAEAMSRCGEDLTRACMTEKLSQLKDFDTQGLSAPLSFDNEHQLSGTSVAVYQLDADTKTFVALTNFVQY